MQILYSLQVLSRKKSQLKYLQEDMQFFKFKKKCFKNIYVDKCIEMLNYEKKVKLDAGRYVVKRDLFFKYERH